MNQVTRVKNILVRSNFSYLKEINLLYTNNRCKKLIVLVPKKYC